MWYLFVLFCSGNLIIIKITSVITSFVTGLLYSVLHYWPTFKWCCIIRLLYVLISVTFGPLSLQNPYAWSQRNKLQIKTKYSWKDVYLKIILRLLNICTSEEKYEATPKHQLPIFQFFSTMRWYKADFQRYLASDVVN